MLMVYSIHISLEKARLVQHRPLAKCIYLSLNCNGRKLRMRANITRKEKVEKSDRVCRKNEEDTERSQRSTDKVMLSMKDQQRNQQTDMLVYILSTRQFLPMWSNYNC